MSCGIASARSLAGSERASEAIACPLTADPVPCCGPPVDIVGIDCCLPTVVTCPRVTIGATPNPSSGTQAVTITGRVFGFPIGQQVTLLQRSAGERSFEPIATVNSGATGLYKIVRSAALVSTNRQWDVIADGLSSPLIGELVRAVVTVKLSATEIAAGGSVRFSGRVAPSHAGGPLQLEEHTAAGWREIARIRLNRSSSYTVVRSFPRAGKLQLRVAMAADPLNFRSYSRTVRIAVRPR